MGLLHRSVAAWRPNPPFWRVTTGPDRAALMGILFVLRTGPPWEHLPTEIGGGSDMTCWRSLHAWQQVGVWGAIHRVLLEHLDAAGRLA